MNDARIRSGDPLSDRMNAIAKYVVSTTLTGPKWHNTTVVDHDPVDAIRDLEQQAGADIVQYGFGPLTRALPIGAGYLSAIGRRRRPRRRAGRVARVYAR